MSQSANTKVVNPDNNRDDIWIACGTCDCKTSHKIWTTVTSNDESPEHDIQTWDRYSVVQCQGCKTLSFCHESECSEDLEGDPNTGETSLSTTIRLYPSRIAGRRVIQGSYELPQGVRQIYQETHAALCAGYPILSGVGIRAIIDAVCAEKSSIGSNLEERINTLVKMGLVTPEGAKILHSLRFMGNKAAHEVKEHSSNELNVAFNVVEHLLIGVYILPSQASKLPKKTP